MLGGGIYSLSDVSRYTRLSSSTVRSWFKWRADKSGGGPLFASDYTPASDDYAVSFLNLIDAYVAAYFRSEGVHPTVIRQAYAILQKDLKAKHPFARADLYTDGITIIRRVAGEMGAPQLADVLSKPSQKVFGEWHKYLGRLEYVDDLAARWRISTGVVIDPQVSFGRPVIKSTGITTFVLANQFQANQSKASLVADLFGVTETDVLNAVQFESQFSKRHAA